MTLLNRIREERDFERHVARLLGRTPTSKELKYFKETEPEERGDVNSTRATTEALVEQMGELRQRLGELRREARDKTQRSRKRRKASLPKAA